MKLTKPQRDAVNCDDNTLVVACPGSGKTRTLVAKLLRCLDDVRGSARRVACITYTHAAVYEIEDRLRAYGKTGDENYCDISTIHSFCLSNVLRRFHWRLPDYVNGCIVLQPDCERYGDIRSSVCDDYSLDSRAYDSFERLNREPDGTPIVQYPLTPEIALDFWERLGSESLVDFPNIIYLSYRLMCDWPSIARALACRFAWILVDEFQDTSALQVEILKLIASQGRAKFFLVGDPFQSIFGFAGAHPELMDEFAEWVNARRDFELLVNFRSSAPVIAHAERLFQRDPPMSAGGDSAICTEEPLYIHISSTFDAIVEHFIPVLDELGIGYGEAAILAPWWIKLLHLGRQLRAYGVPIVGPGARPYKRSAHLFAPLAEQICAYIEKPDPKRIPRIERDLFKLSTSVTGSANFDVYTYRGRKTVFELVRTGQILRKEHDAGLIWLKEAAREFTSILCDEEFLPQSCSHFLIESVNDMESDMVKRGVYEMADLTIADLGMFADYEGSIKLLTMHRAKGREFDAVAIVDLHEGRLPHFSVRTSEEAAEARRVLYVSVTRARRILMYITDEEDPRNRPSRFLLEEGLGLIPWNVKSQNSL